MLGILGFILLYRIPRTAQSPHLYRGWFIRSGRWFAIPLYGLVAIFGAEPQLANLFGGGLQVLQIEGTLLTLLVFLGTSVAWDFLVEAKK